MKINLPTAIVFGCGIIVWGAFGVLEATGHHVPPALWAPLGPLGMFVTAQMHKMFATDGQP